MKRKYIMLLSLLVLVVVLAVYLFYPVNSGEGTPSMTTPGSAETEFELSAEFPDMIKRSYPVYQTDVPTVTVEVVEEIAGSFGMTGKAEMSNSRTGEIKVVDDSKGELRHLSMYPASGAVLYEIPDKQFPDRVTEQPLLPARDEAVVIADVFLKERGQRPPDAEVSAVEVDQQHEVWEAGMSEPKEVYNITLAVRYERTLDGLQVYGDEMAVIIGDGGEVVGMVKCWREIEDAGEATVISAEEAYENLKVGKTIRPREMPGYDRVVIEEITLGYWMEPRVSEQETVMPVWVFKGTVYYDHSEEPYQEYVAAVE